VARNILGGSSFAMLRMAEDIAYCHHERWDGSGYPQGLAGEEIPEAARIVTLVDAFDAMSCDRVYRRAMDRDDVLALLAQGRGSHFEPRIYDCFQSLLPQLWAIRDADN
jgi:putative two-component system response regulator